MVAHCEDLMAMCLDLDDVPHSGKAFSLITTSCDNVFRAITDRDLLTTFSASVLRPEAPPVAINRFAMMAREVILFNPDQPMRPERFIPFVQYRSVFEMFSAFLANEERTVDLQEALKTSGFAGHVLAAVDALPTEGFDAARASMLFKLVLLVSECVKLANLLYEPAVTTQLFKAFVDAPTVLLNAQWAAVLAVTSQRSLAVLGEEISRILACINAAGDSFSPYQVAAIRLAQKLCGDVVHRVAVIEAALPARFAEILTKFSRHTIAQTAIAEFTVAVAKSEDFGIPFLEVVLPIVGEGLRTGSVEQRGFALNFLRELKKAAPTVIRKMVAEENIRRFIELDIVVGKPYGGLIPPPAPRQVNPNQQLLNLLMQLVQNPNRGP
jgi:hypothetical protein